MCGITGFFDFTKQSSEHTVAEMTAAMPHRGPDGQGVFFEQSNAVAVGLGHRRLSIIDLSHSADQPMFFEDYVIVFNGEIYNYSEIKEELISKGHQFSTSSDTEMILHAFAEWKTECVHQFIGMFAFVIYDRKTEEVWMFRDRTGIKPLYVSMQPDHLLFASELKCFHKFPRFKKKLNIAAVSHFLQYGYMSGDHCVFEGVEKLAPGHFAYCQLKDIKFKIHQYWSAANYYSQPKQDISFDEALNETESIIANACNYRMVADVPVGVFLSGGYDSTLVTSLLQKDRTEKIKTFTIGVEDKNLNEAEFAGQIAAHLGTDHSEIYCTEQEMLQLIEQLPFFYDEPFGDSSAVPTMLVSREARKNVTVALSADGGDEVFGGYNRYDYVNRLSKIQKIANIPFPLDWAVDLAVENPEQAYRYKQLLKNPSAYSMADLLNRSYTPSKLAALFRKEVLLSAPNRFHDQQISGNLRRMMYYDYVTYLPDDILTKVDRATMSASLEGREPLLDHRILEWAAKLPESYKINNGQKKYILRQIVHRYVPQEIMERPKMGFAVPVKKWMESVLSDQIDYYLSDDFLNRQDVFNTDHVRLLRKDIISGKDRHYQKLWYLVMFQMWYEKWMLN